MGRGARAVAPLVLAAASLGACGPARDRDCRVLLPRLEEADESTALAGNARGDATRVYAMQAARSASAARWLQNATIETEELKRGIPRLVDALLRHGEAAGRGDGALRALGIHAVDGGAGPGPALAKLFAPESRAASPYLADATTLNERCGFFLAEPRADHPECAGLTAVLAHLLAPEPGVLWSSHVADCLAELGALHAPEPGVEKALRSVETLAREVGGVLVAATRDDAAAEVIAKLHALMKAARDEQAAVHDVARASAEIRAMCRTP